MHGPRLTEERLRNYLDGDQAAQERMCIALLPLLGPYTQCQSRRPKGGPDGARDIECLLEDVITWGAVGFRNGGGNHRTARTAIQKKFRQDLVAALRENPDLESFLFFTNVDLTPDQKEKLVEFGQENQVTTVRVYDLEILRNILDSREGLHYRLQYLDILENGELRSANGKIPQSSKISSYELPVRLTSNIDGSRVDYAHFETFSDNINKFLSYAFGHTCVTTPFDDFVFIMSLEKGEWETEQGYIPFLLTVHCHITSFVWAFQECCKYFIEGTAEQLPIRMQSLPGDQTIDIRSQFGENLPHRIYRSGPTRICIEDLSGKPFPLDRHVTTSTLLRLLAVGISGRVLLWDDMNLCPDMNKIIGTLGRINDLGYFYWEDFHIDRDNPESWEFVGER